MKHALLFVAVTLTAAAQQSDLPLAPTPIMGWGTWNHYRGAITEAEVRANAAALVSTGLRDLGYTFVNVDGHWQGQRDATGVLRANPQTFPTFDKLGADLHAMGLKFGVYFGPGYHSCGGNIDSYGHEDQDAATWASWGADYLKYDLCSFRTDFMTDIEKTHGLRAAYDSERAAYEKMHQALRKTGRPIYFALCQYGDDEVWTWAPDVRGTMYRTTEDIADNWNSMSLIGFAQAGLAPYIRKGYYADPDQLEIGNGGMKPDEYRLQFSLWSMLAAPLILGNDLTHMDADTLAIVSNKEVIAIDQDPLVHAADRIWAHGEDELWARELSGHRMAVALFNRTNAAERITFHLADIHWQGPAHPHNIWTHADEPTVTDAYTATIPRHAAVVLTLSH